MNWSGVPDDYRNAIVTGDALDYLRRFPDGSVPMFLFSPPYNLSARATGSGGFPNRHYPKGRRLGHYPDGARLGQRGGNGKWSGGALAQGYGQVHDDALPPEQYRAWQQSVLRECWRALRETGAIYYQHKPRVINGVLRTPLELVPEGVIMRQIVIWARAGGINFSPAFYCPTHEWVVVLAKPDFRLRDKAASGAGDVWSIPQERDNPHPAPFPLKLAQTALETVRPEFVVDPFIGSGTTAVAAKQLGLGYCGNDLSPVYVEQARGRVAATAEPNAPPPGLSLFGYP